MITPFTAIATSSTITPRIEIYTTLACSFIRPECGENSQQPGILGIPHSNYYRIPALAHQSFTSSVDISDVFMVDKSLQTSGAGTPPTRKQRCASDPVVQAAVAKLTTRAYGMVFIYFWLYMYMLFVAGHQVLEELPMSSLCW